MDVQKIMQQLKTLFDEQKFQEIEDQAWDLTEQYPEEIELFLLLGKAAIKNENYSQANFYFVDAMIRNPENTEPLFLLAELSILLGDNSRAEGYFYKILTIDPDNIPALTGTADLAYSANFYKDAAEQYLVALKKDAQEKLSFEQYSIIVYKAASSLYLESKQDEALALIEEYSPDEFSEMIYLAKLKVYESMGKGGFSEAAECLEKLYSEIPDEPTYLLQLLPYLDMSTESEKIESLFNTFFSLEINMSQKENALRMRSELRTEAQNWEGALEDLNSLLEINETWVYYKNRSEVKEALNDIKGAINDLGKAMKTLGEKNNELSLQRGILLIKAKAFDLAIADFDNVLKITKTGRLAAEAFYNKGIAFSKKKETLNAVKMLLRAEKLGNIKAKEVLMKNFSEQITKIFSKSKDKFQSAYEKESERNQRSPILKEAFGKLWVPNMKKFFQTMEKEIETLPGNLIRGVLDSASKDLFLITAQGILFMEGEKEPLEAFYKVVIESEHSILLELQPSKGSPVSNMRLALFEENLLITYPVAETEVSAKYFMNSKYVSEQQKTRLTNKNIEIPYIESIEKTISKVVSF